MQKDLELTNATISVKGVLSGPEALKNKVAPLIIFVYSKQDQKLIKAYTHFLNQIGALTFSFSASSTETGIQATRLAFEQLRQRDDVYGEMIVLAGQGSTAGIVTASAARIGKSVKGVILLSPEFSDQDLDSFKAYPGQAMIASGDQDRVTTFSRVKTLAHEMPHSQLIEIHGAGHRFEERDINRVKHLMQLFILTALN